MPLNFHRPESLSLRSWRLGPWPVAGAPTMRVPPVRPVTVAIGQSRIEAWPLNPGPGTSIRSVGSGAMVAVFLRLFCSHYAGSQVGLAYEVQRMVKPPISYISGATRRGNNGGVEKRRTRGCGSSHGYSSEMLRGCLGIWGKVARRIPAQD